MSDQDATATPVAAPRARDAHCRWCGQPRSTCDGACRPELEPPRFCPSCGRRMTVQVTPGGFTARCREHGPLGGSAAGRGE